LETTRNDTTSIDARALRMLLAAERVTCRRFARACGLDESYASRLLNGHRQPGELARIRLARGLRALGLSLNTTAEGPDAA
jgi:transcriptional regulator with XRE-family HTH domain